MKKVLLSILLLIGAVTLGGCVTTTPYESAFLSCDRLAQACYRDCERFEDEAGYNTCQAQCDSDINICFDRANESQPTANVGRYGGGFYNDPWYGRYGSYHPNYGYVLSFSFFDRYGYRARRHGSYYGFRGGQRRYSGRRGYRNGYSRPGQRSGHRGQRHDDLRASGNPGNPRYDPDRRGRRGDNLNRDPQRSEDRRGGNGRGQNDAGAPARRERDQRPPTARGRNDGGSSAGRPAPRQPNAAPPARQPNTRPDRRPRQPQSQPRQQSRPTPVWERPRRQGRNQGRRDPR